MKAKGIIALVLTAMLAVSGLSGCGKEKVEPTPKPTESTAQPQESVNPLQVSKDPITLSLYMHSYTALIDGDMPVFKKAEEFTNVTLKNVVSKSQTDPNVSFNTMIASKPLPDIVHKNRALINEYALIGAFVPLDELIEKHAPNIKKYFDANPEQRKNTLASDGKMYYLPSIQAQLVKTAWFVRKDWLDKLGLQVPKTVDEFYAVAKAFRENDPNGNGQKDEVPIFNRNSTVAIIKLLNLFGVQMQDERPFYVSGDKINYSYFDPEFKNAMINMAKWYKEGLIDQELFTRKDARTALLSNNLGGITNDWHGSTSDTNVKFKDKVPGYNFMMMKPPADIKGKVWDAGGSPLSFDEGWAISADNKRPVETIKYMDFWFTPEGRTLLTMGVEGLSYNMVNGEKTYTDAFLRDPEKTLNVKLGEIGATAPIGGFVDIDFWKGFLSKDVFDATQLLMKEVEYTKPFPNLPLDKNEIAKTRQISTAVETYVNEKLQKWIMGVEPVEENYDKFIQEVKNLGMDELLDIYTKAYKKYQQ